MALSGPGGTWRRSEPGAVAWPVSGWAVWYADGSAVRSSSSSWAAAPREGVQVVMLQHPNGKRTIVANCDEYAIPGEARTLLGLEVDFAQYERVRQLALADDWRG